MSSASFSYEPVGATRDDLTVCPPGFHPMLVRTRIGEGQEVFDRAAEAVLTWEMHRAMGVGIDASAERAASGVNVTVTLAGLIKAPCRIIWTIEHPRRSGWAYGTLEGHPEAGEEAFSRGAKWYARAGGPATRGLQHAYARRCGVVLRKLSSGAEED